MYHVTPLQRNLSDPFRPALSLLFAAGGFVLLLVSANAASLLLARSLRRQRDWAIRGALGAGRLRLLRQTLVESSILACAGALPGILLGTWGSQILLRIHPVRLPRADEIGLDGTVVAFAVAVAGVSALLAASLPAWRAGRIDLASAFRARGGRSGGGMGRAGRWLAGAEVAIAVTLLLGTGLVVRSFLNLRSVELGFEPAGVLTLLVPLQESLRADEPRLRLARDLVARTRELPGVEAAALTNVLPLAGSASVAAWAYDEASGQRFGELAASFQRVWPGYFSVVGTPILAGRDFEPADTDHRRDVVVVDEGLARLAWPDSDPIGRRILVEFLVPGGGTENRWAEVVGLVPTVRRRDLHSPEEPQVYLPYWPGTVGQVLVIRAEDDPLALVPRIRQLAADLGTGRPVTDVRLMTEYVDDATRETRFLLSLVGTFAGVALLLAALGVYATSSHLVGERTREIGVRMVLGASRREVFRSVLSEGLAVTIAGTAAGVAVALALTRGMEAMLVGVSPHDPVAAAAAVGALVVVSAIALCLPAHRATRIDPLVSIRTR